MGYIYYTLFPKNRTGLFCFLSAVLFLPFSLRTQPDAGFQQYRYQKDFHFRRLGIEEGLSNAQVTDILQDRLGFIWVATSDGLNRYDGYEFKIFKNDTDDPYSLSNNRVTALLQDDMGFLWVGTGKGLNRYDPRTGRFDHFFSDTLQQSRLRDDHIRCLIQDRSGLIWIGTNRGGLNVFVSETQAFSHYVHQPGDTTSIGDNCVQAIHEDRQGNLWLGTMGGLCFFDRKNGKFTTWSEDENDPNSLSQNWVNAVFEDPDGFIWAGATHGLNRFNPVTGRFEVFWPNSSKPFWLGPNGHRILSFHQDRSGNFWIGTQWGGLYRHDFCSGQYFGAIFDISNPNSLSDNVVTCFFQDGEGMLWIGTHAGISLLAPSPNSFRIFSHNPADTNSLRDNYVNAFLEVSPDMTWIGTEKGGLLAASGDFSRFERYPSGKRRWLPILKSLALDTAGTLWLGTMGSGFASLDPSVGAFQYKIFQPSNRNFILSTLISRQGEIWFGSLGGLNRYHPETGQASYFPFAPEDPLSRMNSGLTCIFEDHENRLWVGTSLNGLKVFNRQTLHYRHFPVGGTDGRGPRSASISFVFQDGKNRIWVGTADEGFYRYDSAKDTFCLYSQKDGLAFDAVYGMAEDHKGMLWIATGRGLSRFDPETDAFRNYDTNDGLPYNSLHSIYCGPYTGRIYVGTPGKGFAVFHPDSLTDNSLPPPVVISSLHRFRGKGKELVEIVEKGIATQKKVRLSYRDDILVFHLAALSFLKTPKNQYTYMLEGFNAQWIPLGTRREITFTNLNPGFYTLRVRATNGDGVWSPEETALKIRIPPPWYASGWAFFFYLSAGVLALRTAYRFQLSKKLAAAEARRLNELDAFKSRFFTNITHEFRTPLTIIGGMAGQIRENPGRWMEEGIDMIERNSVQLLSLVTQMLDLAKLESGALPLKMQRGDIIAYLKYLVESFHSHAASKSIKLSFEPGFESLEMDYDPEKMQQIVSNLLSNAIKFTPELGKVWMSVSLNQDPSTSLLLEVGDTGPGIPLEKAPFVFDRFFQAGPDSAHSGTGIGLALTRELVRLLGGQIELQSPKGEGAVFLVSLPVKTVAPVHSAPALAIAKTPPALAPDDMPLVLIVEDSPDVIAYLFSCLERQYRLEAAYNGLQGLEKAFELGPDLIVSDVMMPEKDGFELCSAVKADIRTSHIPIILLTARADIESRLQGLDCGADVYLPKPFQKNEMLVRVRKLLELRRGMRDYYLSLAAGAPHDAPEGAAGRENEFVLRVRQQVEAQLSNPRYTVEQLCRDLTMSYSQLHRKLTALTGYSANHFIRYIRLCEAKRLLSGSDLTIAEAAFRAGFEDPGYFARAFKKEFGETPKGWKEK